jgi:hypothetical protein
MRQRLEAAVRAVREALSQHDATLATQRAEELKRLVQEAGTTLYGHATHASAEPTAHTGPGYGGAQPTGPGPQGRVVDAEYHTTPR